MSADQVTAYLTGADEHGGPQLAHALSLGLYRSGWRAGCLTAHRFAALRGVRIDYVAPINGPGLGVLTAERADYLAWTPPGGTQGAQVLIANGEQKVLYGGTDADKFVMVTRTSADDLGGTETTQLLDDMTNVIGGSGFDGDESAAGETKYRALMFLNGGATEITDLRVWVDPAHNTNLRIALEKPAADALTDKTVAGETSQPGGLSWSTPTTEATALVIAATLAADAMIGMWIEQIVTVGAAADPLIRTVLHYRFTESAVNYYGDLRGLHRVAENGIEGYATWIGVDAEPDLTAAPDEVELSAGYPVGLPYDLTTVFTAGSVYHVARGWINQYGLVVGDPVLTVIRADDSSTPPGVPSVVSAIAAPEGEVNVVAAYFGVSDGPTEAVSALLRPNLWLVYVSDDGDDPDPATDTPIEVTMTGRAMANLDYTTTGNAWLEEQPLAVAVATRREDEDAVTPVAITDNTATSPTVVTSAAHGMQVGDLVTESGSTDANINGQFLVGTVPSTTSYTLTDLAGVAINSGTGGTGGNIDTYIRDVDSGISEVIELEAEWWGPLRPPGGVSARQAYGFHQEPIDGPTETVYADEPNNIHYQVSPGQVVLWGDNVKIWTIKYDSLVLDSNGFYLEFGLELEDIDVAGSTDPIEVLSWTGGDKRLGVNVNGTRRMLIDVTNTVIKHNGWVPGDPTGTRANVPAWNKWAHTCFQVWDRSTREWVTAWELQSDGYATGIVGIR